MTLRYVERGNAGTGPSLNEPQSQTRLSSAAVLRSLRRRWRIIAICAGALLLASVAFSLLREDQYSATATLLFRDPALDEKLFGGERDSTDPFRAAATNLELVSLDVVADRTAEELDEVSEDDVEEKVEISERGQSDLISVTATDSDPEQAALIANTFAENFIELRREADQQKVIDAQEVVQQKLDELDRTPRVEPEEAQLRERLEQLTVLTSLQTGNAELAEQAEVPDDPSDPGPAWTGVVGLLLGLVLGSILALLIDRFDRRVRDPREVESGFDRPILAWLPEGDPGDSVFRTLAANLRYFAVNRELRSIGITSAGAGDGKTTVARGLARALAAMGGRPLLIEADLRHPADGPGAGRGLSEVLAGEGEWEAFIARAADGFDLLPSGGVPPNPEELLGSDAMTRLLQAATARYDVVVVDMPESAGVPDAVPVLGQVDGAIAVVRVGGSTRDGVETMRLRLGSLSTRLLGLVMNSATGDAPADGQPAAPQSARDRAPVS